MEKTRETAIICWGNIWIMEKKIETTIVYWGYIRAIMGLKSSGFEGFI